jgi:hypothetical protein
MAITMAQSNRHKSLRRRFLASETKFTDYRAVRERIEHFMGPVDDDAGVRTDVFDFTAIDGREKLSASIHGSLVPQSVRWFQGAYRKRNNLNKNPEAAKYRDEVIDEVWNTLGASDFYLEMASACHEATGPGNALMAVEPVYEDLAETELETIDFTAIPTNEARWEQDRRGEIKTFWHEFEWEPSQIDDFCEAKGYKKFEDITLRVEKANRDPVKIVHCIFPREKIIKRKKMVYPAAPENRPWGSLWWREDTGEVFVREMDGKAEGGYYEKPIHLLRWSRKGNGLVGYGPGNIALPTVEFVNAWLEDYLKAGEKALDPPTIGTNRNMLTELDHRPGRHTLVRDVDDIKEIPGRANFVVADKIIEMLFAQIRQIFRTDDLQLKESPAMTAMEVQVRYEIMNRLLGKTLTFIQQFLGAIIRACISILMRAGRLPEMPKVVEKAGGAMNIEYQGPLARSQRTDEVAAVERWVSMIYGMAQFDPRIRAAIAPKKIAEYLRERLGIPADLMPTEQEMEARMKEIDSMEQRAVASQAQANEAKAAKDNAAAQAAGPVQGAVYPSLPPKPPLAPSGRVAAAGIQ